MAGINIATAYLTIIPSMQGVQGEMTRSGEEAGGLFGGAFGKILKGGLVLGAVKELGEAAGAAFSATFGEAMERQATITKAGASLGISDADAKSLGGSAGKLYAQAYGDSFEGVTDALSVVKSSLKDLGADQLEGATKKALSFSQAFDIDVSRSVSSVSTLLGSGLVKSSDEAFDVITKASQKVPAALREDVLDASDEYSQFFRTLGFDASDAFGALTAASDKGVFGIDKTGDAIKEFTIRATDMSTTSVGAFKAIGLDAQTMANQILAGGDTAQGATQQIVDGLLGIKDPATQANTAIALFGTPLEDLGVQDIPKFLASLDDASGGLGDFAGAAADVDAKLGSTISSKFTSLTRTLEGFGPTLSTAFFPVVGPILDGLTGIATKAQTSLQSASDNITGFFAGFKGENDGTLTDTQLDWFNWGMNIQRDLQGPLNTAKSYLQDFQGAFSTLVTGDFDPSKWFAPPEEDSALVDFLLTIRETVGTTFKDLVSTGQQVWGQLAGPLTEAFKTIWDAVKPLVPTFLELFQAFNPVGLLFKALLPVLPQIAGVVGQLAKVLADGVAKALQAVAPLFETVVGVINRLMPFVTQLVASLLPPFVALIDKLAPLLDAVLDALVPVVNALVDALIPAIDALMPIVERVFTFIADTIGNIVQVFSGVIDFITGIFTGDWEKVWTGVKEIFGGIWDQIKNIFGTLWDVIVEFFTNLGPTLWGIVTGLADQLVQWGGQFLGWIWQGIQDLWNNTVWPWFVSLPGLAWEGIQAAAGWMVDRGAEFLQWLWDGITTKFGDVKNWFFSLPGWLWDKIVEGKDWIFARGQEFLQWIWDGIIAKKDEVVQWFKDLPGLIWDAVKGIWTSATEWGGQLMKYVVDGISGSDPYVSAAFAKTMINAVSGIVPVDTIAGLFNIDINKNIDDYIAELQVGSAQAGGSRPRGSEYRGGGRATGGIIPGIDPGRGVDNMLVPMRSGESVFVPEFTRAIGGEATVHAWNRAAEQGRLGEIFGAGYAGGGVIGDVGRLVGGSLMKAILPSLLSGLTTAVQSATPTVGGANSSQDPSSFGWQRAQGITPFAWNGVPFVGGVANGTQSLWTALMNALVPQIPGGLMAPIWAYENRDNVNSPGRASFHAYGLAADINAPQNPNGAPGDGRSGPGVIPAAAARSIAARLGMEWGGDFGGTPDPMHFEIHLSPSAIGGAGGGSSTGGFFGAIASGFMSKIGGLFGGAGSPAPVDGGAFPPMVERWRGLLTDVLTQVGAYKGLNLLGDVDRGLNQIRTESSGDPDAINLTDSNATVLHDPSIGLLQVIGSTFRNALSGTPFANLIALGQRNPRASLTASTLYSLGRYKTLANAWRGVAYRTGGMVPDLFGGGIDSVPAMLTPQESVLTPPQTEAYQLVAEALVSGDLGGRDRATYEFNGDIHMGSGDEVALMDEVLWRARVAA